jgi:phage tail-like protein
MDLASLVPGDPSKLVTTNRFYVEMDGLLIASFSECSGIDISIDKDTYFEGGVNNQQRIFLKQAKFGDITLKRGITDDTTFWKWIDSMLQDTEVSAGSSSSSSRTERLKSFASDTLIGSYTPERRNIGIMLYDQSGMVVQGFYLLGAIPVAWKTPALQADSSSVAIEELTLAYEGFQKLPPMSPIGGPETRVKRDELGYFGSNITADAVTNKAKSKLRL